MCVSDAWIIMCAVNLSKISMSHHFGIQAGDMWNPNAWLDDSEWLMVLYFSLFTAGFRSIEGAQWKITYSYVKGRQTLAIAGEKYEGIRLFGVKKVYVRLFASSDQSFCRERRFLHKRIKKGRYIWPDGSHLNKLFISHILI